jgi:hypothetical protein
MRDVVQRLQPERVLCWRSLGAELTSGGLAHSSCANAAELERWPIARSPGFRVSVLLLFVHNDHM